MGAETLTISEDGSSVSLRSMLSVFTRLRMLQPTRKEPTSHVSCVIYELEEFAAKYGPTYKFHGFLNVRLNFCSIVLAVNTCSDVPTPDHRFESHEPHSDAFRGFSQAINNPAILGESLGRGYVLHCLVYTPSI